MERSGWRNRKLRDCSEFCVSHQQQYSFNLQDEANERVLYPSFYRMWRFLQFGNDCRSIVSGVHHGIRSLSKMAALPSTAQDDCRASRCRQSTKGKLILHTTVNKKSKSIFLELFFCYSRWPWMRYTLSYPICRVKVTRRSVLPVRRSDPPWSCMICRERLNPMPEPSGLVV